MTWWVDESGLGSMMGVRMMFWVNDGWAHDDEGSMIGWAHDDVGSMIG